MKIKHLMDALKKVNDARQGLHAAQLAIYHGGNAETMWQKNLNLIYCTERLQEILEEEINED